MILVVGGHSRKIGKSSVVASLITEYPQADWIAIKITSHQHDTETASPYSLTRETAVTNTDSGRYLAAGAGQSYLLRVSPGRLAGAVPDLRKLCSAAANTIIESNRIVDYLKPDLYLQVVDPTVEDWKESARKQLQATDAFVVVSRKPSEAIDLKLPSAAPRFVVEPPRYASPELLDFVAGRMRLER